MTRNQNSGWHDPRRRETGSAGLHGRNRIAEEPRDPFGRIPERPNAPISKLRKAWREGRLFDDPASRIGSLSGGVGDHARNAPEDVAKVEILLHRAGAYDLGATDGPTGIYGSPQRDALLRFQKDRGLKPDALVNPDGPTVTTLAAEVGAAGRNSSGAHRNLLNASPEGEERAERPADGAPQQVASAGAIVRAIPLVIRLLKRAPKNAPAAPPGKKPSLLEKSLPPASAVVTEEKNLRDRSGPDGDTRPAADLPPLPGETAEEAQARRAAINQALLDDIVGTILENRRGDEFTQHGNDIFAQECRAVLDKEFPDIADRVQHLYGTYKDGDRSDKNNYREEKYVPRPDAERGDHRDASFSDLAWGLVDEEENEIVGAPMGHANTVSVRQSGQMTGDERRRLANLIRNAADNVVQYLRKLRAGDDEDEYRKEARSACRTMFTELREKIREYDEHPSSNINNAGEQKSGNE